MRYLGNKTKLLPEIDSLLWQHAELSQNPVLLDVFAGTGAVSKHFKSHFRVLSNDYMTYSFHLLNGHALCHQQPKFKKLPISGDVLNHLNQLKGKRGFITDEYSCAESEIGMKRSFFQEQNGMKIDAIRQEIQQWKEKGYLSQQEESYLIACLIEAVSKIANIGAIYDGYFKFWEKRSHQPLTLVHPQFSPNASDNQAYQHLVEEWIIQPEIQGDVAYIDPPYGSRSYASRYHLLETIARYDEPEIKGKVGVRIDVANKKSIFGLKKTAYDSFDFLLKHIQAKNIILSYSSDGVLSQEEIATLMKTHGKPETFVQKEIPYKAFQSKYAVKKQVNEFLFFVQK